MHLKSDGKGKQNVADVPQFFYVGSDKKGEG